MLQSTPIPSLPPPTSSRLIQSPSNTATIDWENAIKVPPPTSSRIDKQPQRPRSSVDLPPLVKTPPTSKPSRSSLFLPIKESKRDPSPPRSRANSPNKEPIDFETHTFTDNDDGKSPTHSKSAKLASWFNGGSEPVNIGLVPSPKKEKSDPLSTGEEQEVSHAVEMDKNTANALEPVDDSQLRMPTSTAPTKLQKRMSASPTRPHLPPTTSSTSTPSSTLSRFSFFKSKSSVSGTPVPTTNQSQDQEKEDPLLTLSIPHALFPHGPTSEFSPAAFKNLQQNAEGTLSVYQKSYRSLHSTLRSLRSAHTIQADDLSASQTRVEALKTQLSAMAARAQEQETALEKVTEELMFERQCRREEEEMRRGTIKLIQPPYLQPPIQLSDPELSAGGMGGREGRGSKTYRGRGGRISDISASSISSVDIDAASEVDSVFSAPLDGYGHGHPRSASPVTTDGGMSPMTKTMPIIGARSGAGGITTTRRNGTEGQEAWDVVEIMREESRALKERIAELEGANEGALEMLRGLGLQ